MAKPKRPTVGKFKLSDIEVGKDYSDNKFEKIIYDLTGRKTHDDVKSVNDVASFTNHMLIVASTLPRVDRYAPGGPKLLNKFGFEHEIKKSDLFEAKYNESLGGYILDREDHTYGQLKVNYAMKILEANYGYSVRSVTRKGVTYDNVITKKIKTKDGHTRYEIAK